MLRSASILDVLHRRTFRYLFVGVTFSRVGDAMTLIVLSWIALGIGGPRAVGLVTFAGGFVYPLSAPLMGYLLDKLGLRILLLTDNLTRGILMLGLAALVQRGHVRLEYLIAFAVLSGLLSPATELGQNVAVPTLLESGELDAANRLLVSSWEIAASLGPAFAGVAIGLIGSASVLFVDAGTFFVMALVALAMPGRPDPSEKDDTDTAGGMVSRLLSGFRVFWRLRPVAILTIVGVANLFLGGMMEVFLPAFNKLTLHQGPGQYGLLVSLAGAACLCGTLFLSRIAIRLGYGPGLVAVLAVRGIAILPLAFVGSWGLAAVFVAIAALPDGGFAPLSYSIQQRLIPAHMRGRVQGAKATLSLAGWPLGCAVGGVLFSAIGAHSVVALMAIGYLPLAVTVLLTPTLMNYSVPNSDERLAMADAADDSRKSLMRPISGPATTGGDRPGHSPTRPATEGGSS
jgi:MFS family permease